MRQRRQKVVTHAVGGLGFFAGVATPAFPTAGFGKHAASAIGGDIPFSAGMDCAVTNCGTLGVNNIISPLYSAYSPVLTPLLAANSNQRYSLKLIGCRRPVRSG